MGSRLDGQGAANGLGWRHWTPAASHAMVTAAGLVGALRKHDSGHDFSSSLAWEKESEEGNAFRGLERGAGIGEGRRW
jgi:hypothetical protein